MIVAALLCLLCATPQDDAAIVEWIRQLGDDSVEVREQAGTNLTRAGRAAEKRLREALKSPNEEVRGRAAQILAGFDHADRMREFDAGPSRITLKRDRVPLKEVLEEIQKQTRTRLDYGDAPLGDKVSISAEREPLFRALDALSRAHGGIALTVESRRGDNVVATLAAGTPSKRPHCFHEQYLFVLDSVHTTTTYDLAGGSASRMRLTFGWAWEKGTRPLSVSLRLRDVVDGAGKSYAGDLAETAAPLLEAMRTEPGVSTTITVPFAPPDTVDRLASVKGDLELSFPEGVMNVAFEKPMEKMGTEQRAAGGSVKLVTFGQEGRTYRARVMVQPAELSARLEAKAVDQTGKEVVGRGRGTRVLGADDEPITLEFVMPEAAGVTALRFSAPTGAREKKVPFEFRDLRIR